MSVPETLPPLSDPSASRDQLGLGPVATVQTLDGLTIASQNMSVDRSIVPTTCSSIADLKNLDTRKYSNGSQVSVSGYYSANDGGGGTYVWNSTSTAADNGGTIIQPTGVPTGCWLLQFSGPINVRWFGAYGDGTHDDSSAINNAIAAACQYSWKGSTRATELAAVSGAVYFPKGTYLCQSKIKLAPALRIFGDGVGNFLNEASTGSKQLNTQLLFNLGGSFTYAVDTCPYNASGTRVNDQLLNGNESSGGTFSFAESIVVENIHFVGDNSCRGLNLAGAPQVRVNNCRFTSFVVGLRLSASWFGSISNTMFECRWRGLITWQGVTTLTVFNIGADQYGTAYNPAVSGYDGSEAPAYLAWTQADQNSKSAGIYNYYGTINGTGATIENWDVAISTYNGREDLRGIYTEGIQSRIVQCAGADNQNSQFAFYTVNSPLANFIWLQQGYLRIDVQTNNYLAANYNKLVDYYDCASLYAFYPEVNGITLKASGDPVSGSGTFGFRKVLTGTPTQVGTFFSTVPSGDNEASFRAQNGAAELSVDGNGGSSSYSTFRTYVNGSPKWRMGHVGNDGSTYELYREGSGDVMTWNASGSGDSQVQINKAAGTNYATLNFFDVADNKTWAIGCRTAASAGSDTFSIFSSTLGGNVVTFSPTGYNIAPTGVPASPSSGWTLYVDSSDGNKLKAKASTGTVVIIGIP